MHNKSKNFCNKLILCTSYLKNPRTNSINIVEEKYLNSIEITYEMLQAKVAFFNVSYGPSTKKGYNFSQLELLQK